MWQVETKVGDTWAVVQRNFETRGTAKRWARGKYLLESGKTEVPYRTRRQS